MRFVAIGMLSIIIGGLSIYNVIDEFKRGRYFLTGVLFMSAIMEIVIMIDSYFRSMSG